MNHFISSRTRNLSESQTIAMSKKSREMKESGIDVISLSLGEPDFNTPDFIKEAGKEGIDQNYTHYPPVAGYKDLREAISRKFLRDNKINYSPEQIVVSTGAKQCIANLMLSILNPGDEVLLPAPYWVSYKEAIKLAEGVPVIIPTSIDTDFKIDGATLEKYINPKSKMLIFSSPCNPTGSLYTKTELADLVNTLEKHENIISISDEIYELINFEGEHSSLASFDSIYDRVVTVNGVSKGFSMTGWRLGYLGAPLEIAKACDKMQGQFTSATSSISQRAAIAALNADPSEVDFMKEAFLNRRNLMKKGLEEIPGLEINTPKGAFYFFPKVDSLFGKKYENWTIKDGNDLCMYLLEEAHVGLVPGEAFGSPDYIRISYAASEENLNEALKRIKQAIIKLS